VKKWLIGILIFQLVVNPSITKELLKLPSLLEHFYHHNHHHSHHHEHKGDFDSHEQMNLLSFLEVHYGGASIHHSEEDHGELPFKSSPNNRVEQLGIQLFVFEPSKFEVHCFIENKNKQPIAYSSLLNSNYLQSIWQPPKIS